MKKLLVPVAIILVVSFLLTLLTACSQTSTTTSQVTTTATATTTTQSTASATTTAGAPKYGGTLRVIYPYSPETTPGWSADATNMQKLWFSWIVWENLVKLDSRGEPLPWLATDWTWAPDKTYIDFNLRKGVKFHDGTDFTAESVVTHVNQLFTDKDGTTKNWDRVEKTGDYSVRFYFKQWTRDFWLALGSWNMFITSDTQLKEKGLDYVKTHPVGTGPFKFESFEKDVSMKFVRFDNYWQTGKPYLDGITFLTVKEPLTQQAKMEAGEGDVLQLKTGKIPYDLKQKGFATCFNTNTVDLLLFDTANDGSLTNDPKVRLAIDYAINKQEMADALGYGGMHPFYQISAVTNPAYNANLPTRSYDPEKAKALLKEAGYDNNLTLHLIAENSGQDYVVMIQSYLAAVGVNVELEMVDNAKLWNYIFAGWNGMVHIEYSTSNNYPYFLQRYFPPGSFMDISVKIPDDILAKTAAAMIETDDAKFKAMSDELVLWTFDNAFIIPTVGVDMFDIMRTEVKDAGLNEFFEFSTWSPELTWLDQ